jgi:hypothetical protein
MNREPLLTRSTVVTIISVLSALLVKTGGGDVSTWLDANSDTIALLILTAAPLATALLSHKHVTPLADPRAKDGTPLVLSGSEAATVAPVVPVVILPNPDAPLADGLTMSAGG